MYPNKLNQLIEALTLLPGVGIKTAERYALALLEKDESITINLAAMLVEARKSLKPCPICHNITDLKICSLCSSETVDKSIICVVSDPKEVFSIQKMNHYHGQYHVLGGLISTHKGVLPQDLNIESLIKRLDGSVNEVILGLNATVEGEMTALYISKKLEGLVKVSRLAFGLSSVGNLDYADELSLMKAFEGRRKI